jgi:hypothetical protein
LNYSSTLIFCTWKECKEQATKHQVGKDGKTWATLCDNHDKELNEALASEDPKKIVSSWVKAKGGAERAAKEFTDGIFGEK